MYFNLIKLLAKNLNKNVTNLNFKTLIMENVFISKMSALETVNEMFPQWLEAKNNNDDKKRRQVAAVCLALLPWIFSGERNLAKFYNENPTTAKFVIQGTYFKSYPLVFDMIQEYNLIQQPNYDLF